MLNYCDEVILENVQSRDLSKLIKSINRKVIVVELKKITDKLYMIRKKNPVNFNIYFRQD